MHANTKSYVQTSDGLTDTINIHNGVVKGHTLSPYLFVIVVDFILRRSVDKYNTLGHCKEI